MILIILVFGLIFGLAIFYSILNQKRIEFQKRSAASSLGFVLLDEPSQEIQKQIILLFSAPHRKRLKLSNLWYKRFLDGEIYLFDLMETSGEDSTTLADQGLLFVSPYLQLPRFLLHPRIQFGGKLADLANRFIQWAASYEGQPVDLSDHPEFSQRYFISGKDHASIRKFFTPDRLNLLTNLGSYSLQADGNSFALSKAVYMDGQSRPEGVVRDRLAQDLNLGMQLYSWLASTPSTADTDPRNQPHGFSTHCSQCGAPIKEQEPGSHRLVCAYCGSPIGFPLGVRKPIRFPDPNRGEGWDLETKNEWIKRASVNQNLNRRQKLMDAGCTLPFAIFWTLFSSIFLIIGLVTYMDDRKTYDLLSREGVESIGIVTDLSQIEDSDGDETYFVRYRFIAPSDGKIDTISQRQSVPERVFNQLEEGMKVEIIYAFSQPSVSELKSTFGPPELILPVCFGGMGLLFTLIGIGMIAGALTSAGKAFLHRHPQTVN